MFESFVVGLVETSSAEPKTYLSSTSGYEIAQVSVKVCGGV